MVGECTVDYGELMISERGDVERVVKVVVETLSPGMLRIVGVLFIVSVGH